MERVVGQSDVNMTMEVDAYPLLIGAEVDCRDSRGDIRVCHDACDCNEYVGMWQFVKRIWC